MEHMLNQVLSSAVSINSSVQCRTDKSNDIPHIFEHRIVFNTQAGG